MPNNDRELSMPMPYCPTVRQVPGFTLIELIVVIMIIAVLAAAAVPSFADHVRRGRIVEAVSRLADHRVRMEQFFLDNRRYDDGAGGCGYVAQPAGAADAFALECTAAAAAYTVTATGTAGKGMQGFVYTIDHANARRTTAVPDGWIASDRCWVVRRDGSCV
jgi:type IV pilus assembly protein PilE